MREQEQTKLVWARRDASPEFTAFVTFYSAPSRRMKRTDSVSLAIYVYTHCIFINVFSARVSACVCVGRVSWPMITSFLKPASSRPSIGHDFVIAVCTIETNCLQDTGRPRFT